MKTWRSNHYLKKSQCCVKKRSSIKEETVVAHKWIYGRSSLLSERWKAIEERDLLMAAKIMTNMEFWEAAWVLVEVAVQRYELRGI